MIYSILAILFSIISVEYVDIKPTKTEISYCKLKLSDFSVKKSADNTVSESVTSIGYNYDGGNKVDVFCRFYKIESFVTIKGETGYILNHEQRHFDITYIYAKRLVKELSNHTELNEKIVEGVYEKILSEKDKVQSQYDSETNNSESKEFQAVWDVKIDKLLTNL